MKTGLVALLLGCTVIGGCDGARFRALWHGQQVASGGVVKVTSFNLVWGVEHDGRDVGNDAFSIEYVIAERSRDPRRREAEALAVFELVRPISEQWGLRSAELAAFPTLERKGRYDRYSFRRDRDGRWSFTRVEARVFATDK